MTIQRVDLGLIHGKQGGTGFQGHELIGTPKSLGGAAAAASVTHTDNAVSTADASTYTFSNRAVGTAAAGRRIIVAPTAGATSSVSISSVTVAGNAATSLATAVGALAGGGIMRAGLSIEQLDAGTTATIVVNLSGAAVTCGIGVFAAYDLQSETPGDTATDSAAPFSQAIDVVADGILVACHGSYATLGQASHLWTNLTERYDEILESGVRVSHSGASAAQAATTTLTVTVTESVSLYSGATVMAALR